MIKQVLSLLAIWGLCAVVASLASHNSITVFGWPLFAVAAAYAVVVQWLAFVPAYLLKTESFYDLTGSFTFLTLVWGAWLFSDSQFDSSLVAVLLISCWALRLGFFLVWRMKKRGSDARFDQLKQKPLRYFLVWNIQALWIVITVSPALYLITRDTVPSSGWVYLGATVSVMGLLIEAIADQQKLRFVMSGATGFMKDGLWSRSQHPNYLGEIMFWLGMSITASAAMKGGALLLWLSPLFVYLLLTRLSGIPLADARAEKKYGDDEQWRAYRRNTPKLVPRIKI